MEILSEETIMLKKREPKSSDQEMTKTAFNLLQDCMNNHPEIESSLWAGAFWSGLVGGYIRSGATYEQFTEEWERIKHHYKDWFDK